MLTHTRGIDILFEKLTSNMEKNLRNTLFELICNAFVGRDIMESQWPGGK